MDGARGPAEIHPPLPQFPWLRAEEKPVHGELAAEPKPWAVSLSLLQVPWSYRAGPLEEGPTWPQEALGMEASESLQGPQGGGSGSGHSKKPRHPSSLSPSNSWPPQGRHLQQSPCFSRRAG